MKNTTQRPATPESLKTDGGKTKSNAIEVPSISLPKGGGAIRGIDEKFAVNAVNGTASLSFPLPISQARGATPSLSVSYSSGAGNGIFGLGWSLGLASIKRKTDRTLPGYQDGSDSDTFLFSEAEDLVPAFKKESNGVFSLDSHGDYIVDEKSSTDNAFLVRRYRPRIEGLFAKIERWTSKATGEMSWRIITKENVTTLFGWSSSSRISDPQDATRIFEWLPEFAFDDKGNCAQYTYKAENAEGFDHSLVHHRNRFVNGSITYTNRYLEMILYGNRTPYLGFGNAFPVEGDFLFSTVFDYGEYDTASPYNKVKAWDFRNDAFSTYKPGFEIRTTRLCKRVFLFHHFAANEYQGLTKSLNFEYDEHGADGFTFLKSITSYGYIKQDDGSYTYKKLPSHEFQYQQHAWSHEVKTLASEDLIHAPAGIEGNQYQFTDLYGEGLSGILSEQANGWYYKSNQGGGSFGAANLVSPKPSFSGLGNMLQLLDLASDGGKQLVNFNQEPKGFFNLSEHEVPGFYLFNRLPNINFKDPNTKMLDLNGDGKAEILIAQDDAFTWYQSSGKEGYQDAKIVAKASDEEHGPHVIFSDTQQSIFLADMSGDGLTDIVRIRNGEVCYWPNVGFGKFGAKVSMANAPHFDHAESFNPSYIKLADIDGSGTTDIIYLGKNTFQCWLNLNGNVFKPTPFELDAFPEINSLSQVTVTDLLGNGVSCIVCSSTLPSDRQATIRYVDLMDSRKPHVMRGYKNNMGKEVLIEYKPSTYFYLEDKLEGMAWATKLHFPVHCIARTETIDHITGHRFACTYRYHHGYFDHAEREFRGFGMVEQTDVETFEHWVKDGATSIVEDALQQDPVTTKTWYHTGAYQAKDKILNDYAKAYWYAEMESEGFAATHEEIYLQDASIIAATGLPSSTITNLTAQELREAYRTCKSMKLRTEAFSYDAARFGSTPDARERELTPFTVGSHNCVVELVQPQGKNHHAVFLVKESETITYHYERTIQDPRIAHSLNLVLDEYGNVIESVAVVYPRKVTDLQLHLGLQAEQKNTIILFSVNSFTNDVFTENIHRLRQQSESRTFELKNVGKATTYYVAGDFKDILLNTKSDEAPYHELNKPVIAGRGQRRLVEHARTLYYKNDLTGPSPLHVQESFALTYEKYLLAYTPELLNDIYTGKATDGIMTEGKFAHTEADLNWWIRSGAIQYKLDSESATDARDRFFSAISYTDPFDCTTYVKYYGSYFLMISETTDELGNTAKMDRFNFRTLAPQSMRDINSNITETLVDELGLVKVSIVSGKGNEADEAVGILESTLPAEKILIDEFFNATDTTQLTAKAKALLQHATSRVVYDLDAFVNDGSPVVSATISREKHFVEDGNSPVQISFEYTGGSGKVVMKKGQAEPGLAKQITINSGNMIVVTEIDTNLSNPKQLRWIGTGRTVLNNKGSAVKQYEPYFAVSHRYEDHQVLVESGVTPFLFYDATGRLVRTELPNGTLSKVVFDAWKKNVFDANDTVLESSWYHQRTNRLIDVKLLAEGKDPVREKAAADKSADHATTPNVIHLNSLGKAIWSVEHYRNVTTNVDEFFETRSLQDAEGNLRSIVDARGNQVMTFKYDMLGNLVYQQSMDAGQRWLLVNVSGNPLRTWDERNHEFQYFYDIISRPTHSKVIGGDGLTPLDHIFERMVYGESLLLPNRSNEVVLQNSNVLGKVIQHFDTGGALNTPAYDFKGLAISSTRKLTGKFKETVNWIDANLIADLEAESFVITNLTDALGRITRQTAPDGSVITPSYNESGLLTGEAILHAGQSTPVTYIRDIDYNESGKRTRIVYGNNVAANFIYDRETFRLNRLHVVRQNNDLLQDWNYTYDPIGNITHIEDRNVPVAFFDNQKIVALSEYTYDALYRLIEATGRENDAALNYGVTDNWDDNAFKRVHNGGDNMATRNYTQRYQYDSIGNIVQLRHSATGNNWTRDYSYAPNNNRLQKTTVGTQVYQHEYHPNHGFIKALPHLPGMGWNFKDELAFTAQQRRVDGGVPEATYYQYDHQGKRIRKVTELTADAGSNILRKEERIYIEGYETYRTFQTNAVNFERIAVSLKDEGERFVMIETVKRNTKPSPLPSDVVGAQLTRYQLHNYQGSASLELDQTAQVISYEEFHPFGTTSYQAMNSAIKATAKRYRYTGAERDEESGLNYHESRYYVTWLGRWLSADPIGIGDGVNLYRYCHNNPVKNNDTNGKQTSPAPSSSSSSSSLLPPPPGPSLTLGPVSLSNIMVTDVSQLRLSASFGINNLFSSDRSVTINNFSASGSVGFTSNVSLPSFNLSGTGGLRLNLDQLNFDSDRFSASMSGSSRIGLGPGELLTLNLDATARGTMFVDRTIFFNNWESHLDNAVSTFRGDATLTGRIGAGPMVGYFRLDASARNGISGPLSTMGYLRLGSYHLLDFSGTGTFSTEGYNVSGSFHGNFPLPLWGNWGLDSREGFRASGHYFGPQFGPFGLNPGINPLEPGLLADPTGGSSMARTGSIFMFEPGTSFGYTYFNYSATGSFFFSAGFSPTSNWVEYSPVSPRIPYVGDIPGLGDAIHTELYGRPMVTPAGTYTGISVGGSF